MGYLLMNTESLQLVNVCMIVEGEVLTVSLKNCFDYKSGNFFRLSRSPLK